MHEHVLLETSQVRVTPSRFTVGGTTYPVRGITSYRVVSRWEGFALPLALGGLAAVFLLLNAWVARGIGAALLAVAALSVWRNPPGPRYAILITSAAGETCALTLRSRETIRAVAAALDAAVSAPAHHVR